MSKLGGELLQTARNIQAKLRQQGITDAHWNGECRGIGRNVWFQFESPRWEAPRLFRLLPVRTPEAWLATTASTTTTTNVRSPL